MLSRKALVLASLSAIVCSLSSVARADDFKSAKFLTYPPESQTSYINSSVLMAGLIAGQNAPAQAKCIGDWSTQHVAGGYRPVIEAMKRFPDHHPTGVIFAVIQKVCGPFKY